MAIAYVNSILINSSGANHYHFASYTPAAGGPLLVCAVRGGGNVTVTISDDSAQNVWSNNDKLVYNDTSTDTGTLDHASNAKNAATVVTVTFNATVSCRGASLSEYSGIGTTAALDKTAGTHGLGHTADSGLTDTTTVNDELLAGAIAQSGDLGLNFTIDAAFTQRRFVSQKFYYGDKIVAATGTYSFSGSFPDPVENVDQWGCLICTYGVPAAGGGVSIGVLRRIYNGKRESVGTLSSVGLVSKRAFVGYRNPIGGLILSGVINRLGSIKRIISGIIGS